MTRRDAYWDMLRGVAIIAVVWIHTRSGAQYDDWNFDYWIILRDAINFPVALFFFIAGYLVNVTKLSPAAPWLRSRAVRLVVPFLIWSSAYLVLGAVQVGDFGNPLTILPRIGLGLTAAHLYFIIVLIQLTILTPLITAAVGTRWIGIAYAVTPVYLAFMYGFAFASGGLPPFYNYAFPAWMIFYVVGLHARAGGWAPTYPKVVPALLVVGTVALAITESYALLRAGLPASFAVSQLKASSVLCSLAVIILVLSYRRQSEMSALSRLGTNSYGVYYVHMVWITVVAAAYARVPFLNDFPFLFGLQLAQLVVAISLSLATMWVARRVLGQPRATRYLGF